MDIDFQGETITPVIDPPKVRNESSVGISPSDLYGKADDIVKTYVRKRKIEKSGDPEIDRRYRLDYATCSVSPWAKVKIGEKEMLARVVEELVPGANSSIEPGGFSIRLRDIGNEANSQDSEKIVAFIENEKTEDGLGREANAKQIATAMELLSRMRESLETSPQTADSNPNETIRMRHFYLDEGARQLPVSP